MEKTAQAMAKAMWDKMDENEKTGVRIGLFPAGKMAKAVAAGFSIHEISVALMDVAAQNGGMIG